MGAIEDFLKITYGSGSGSGSGSGYGDGSGYGSGDGSGSGSGYGSGDGDGSGSGSGDGSGDGSGYGYGDGSGYGDGDGDGSGSGSGYGYGSGSGYGSGDGDGDESDGDESDGDGIKSINGTNVHIIDSLQTIITSVRDNVAKGFILQNDLSLTPCFIVKENNQFSHGKTLHEAFESLQEKLYDGSSEEERIAKFKEHFVDFSKRYSAKELFSWHHILTGSCKSGRESFCRDKGINIETDTFNIYEFIKLTENSYNGGVIKKLK